MKIYIKDEHGQRRLIWAKDDHSHSLCTEPDCPKPSRNRTGYCQQHYTRFRRYGDTTVVNQKASWTADEILTIYIRCVKALGRIPAIAEITNPAWLSSTSAKIGFALPSRSAIYRKYGGWTVLVEDLITHTGAEVTSFLPPRTMCNYIEDNQVCGRPAKGHGYCSMHLQRYKKHGDPGTYLVRISPPRFPRGKMPEICIHPTCQRPAKCGGKCYPCYKRDREWGDGLKGTAICPGCGRNYKISTGHTMCSRCWQQHLNGNIHDGNYIPRNYWKKHECLLAGLRWLQEMGTLPTSRDWRLNVNGVHRPSMSTIHRVFGKWSAYIAQLEAFIAERQAA